MPRDYYNCPICNRKHCKDNMTWHHLYPTVDDNKKEDDRIYLCLTCHIVIHYSYTNKQLREHINTLSKLQESKIISDIVDVYKYKPDDKVFKLKKILKVGNKNARK